MNENEELEGVQPGPEEAQVELDENKLQRFQQELAAQQNIPLAIVGGAVAAIVGAAIWAGIAIGTGYQIGWVAIGIGFLVGFAVRFLGKGTTNVFGIIGAAFAVLGVVLGNLFTICGVLADLTGGSFFEILGMVLKSPGDAIDLLKDTFEAMDLLFYGIAIYCGYNFSFRQIQPEEIAALMKDSER